MDSFMEKLNGACSPLETSVFLKELSHFFKRKISEVFITLKLYISHVYIDTYVEGYAKFKEW